MNNKIQDKLAVLTSNPGVYIMKNAADDIIYVGKAKNLKNRVSQYFVSNSQHSPKVLKMVSNVDHFEYIVTGSELEALILENNLIKQHRPKYNILLKDDKTYPYIALSKNTDFPRFTLSRRRTDPNYRYFGPFQSSKSVWEIIRTMFFRVILISFVRVSIFISENAQASVREGFPPMSTEQMLIRR